MKLRTKTNNNSINGYLTAAVTVGTLASTASAAIVTFSNSGSFIEGTVDNGDEPTRTIPLGDGSTLQIDSDNDGYAISLTFAGKPFGRFTGTGVFHHGFFPGVSLLGFGDTIYANNSGTFPEVGTIVRYDLPKGVPQPDFVGDVSGYIGFITPVGNKGWMDVGYNSTTGLFQYNGGAVETAGGSLTAGQVPEPSTAVLSLGALAAGCMIRRRKQAA